MAQTAKKREPKLVDPDTIAEIAPEIAIPQELEGESVADTLIRARQQYGQDLRSIAQVLCIRYSYLDAIERANYENLPGPTYAVGFVRTYAEFLGLDGDAVVERFKNEVQGLDSQTKLHFPTPAPEGKMPGGAVFLVAALLFAGAYGVWFYLSNKGESIADLVSPVPERLQEMVAEEAPAEVSAVPAATESTSDASSQAAAPATEGASTSTKPSTETATPTREEPAETPAAAASNTPSSPVATPSAPAAPAPIDPAPIDPARQDEPGGSLAESGTVREPQAAALPVSPGDTADPASTSTPSTQGEAPAAPQAGEPAPVITLQQPEAEAVADGAAGGLGQQHGESAGLGAEAGQTAYSIPAAPASNQASSFLVNQEPQVYGDDNADARIVLKANQDAWVQVRDREGTLLLTRVLRVGDSYRVPNQDDLTLLTGNAGGLKITVDGTALAPLGPVGAVRRNIPLDPEKLLSGTGG